VRGLPEAHKRIRRAETTGLGDKVGEARLVERPAKRKARQNLARNAQDPDAGCIQHGSCRFAPGQDQGAQTGQRA
jgi:hypothetical protein